MIIDFGNSDERAALKGEFDFLIAGGGIAGIVLAVGLARSGKRIAVVEGGGWGFDERSQNIYKGRNTGHKYFALDETRLRYLGGTSNHWGGWCRALDEHDFSPKPHIEMSGWPITKNDLDKHLQETLDILEISRSPAADKDLSDSRKTLKEIQFSFSDPPVLFGDKYKAKITKIDNLVLALNANLLGLNVNMDGKTIERAIVKHYGADDTSFSIKSKIFILAMGGIENARFLLNDNALSGRNIGNEFGVLGKYFMEHIHQTIGAYYPFENTQLIKKQMFVGSSEKFLMDNKIANCGLRLLPITDVSSSLVKDNIKTWLCEWDRIVSLLDRYGKQLFCSGWGLVRAAWEQVPNRESRIYLDSDKDLFGHRRAALSWLLSPIDRKTVREFGLELGRIFIANDWGRVRLRPWVLDENLPYPDLDDGAEVAGNHHMGATRMALTAKKGVVDQNCKVFGTTNLYIAGSSVFPTGGHANPTFTIIQLALRMVEHLTAKIGT